MPLLIGIAGKARAGKDTLATLLYEQYGFLRTAFATPLKIAAAEAFSIPIAQFHSQEGKEAHNSYWGTTNRTLLQTFGEAMCQEYGKDFWVKRWYLDYQSFAETDHVVVSDVRKDSEAEFIRRLGGTIVHLQRDGAGLQGTEGQHVSERGVEQRKGDAVLRNNGTLADLAELSHKLVAYAMQREAT